MSSSALHVAPAIASSSHVRRIPRRVAAVLGGLLTIFVVTTATDVALHAAGVFPPFDAQHWTAGGGPFLLALAYRIVYGIAGCYVTARLAPDRPIQHALALGAVGVVLSTAGAIALWDAGPGWYSLGVIAISLPCAWTGGKLRDLQLRARRAPVRGSR